MRRSPMRLVIRRLTFLILLSFVTSAILSIFVYEQCKREIDALRKELAVQPHISTPVN